MGEAKEANEEPAEEEGGGRLVCGLSGRADRMLGLRPGGGRARLRASVVVGPSWTRLSGPRTVVSQLCRPATDAGARFNFDLPIDVTYKSDSPCGWPQIVLTVFGINSWGAEVTVGYGRTHFPTVYGERKVSVPLFAPKPTAPLGSFVSWFTGKTPELINPDILADGNENYLLQTTSCGSVEMTLNLITKGMNELGYDNVPAIQSNYNNEYS